MKKEIKYKLIEDYINGLISSGDLKPGDQIPTEKQLSEKFNIGHITVNKALSNLAYNGVITRKAGKGSFVSQKMLAGPVFMGDSFYQELIKLGLKPSTKLIEYKLIKAKDKPELLDYLDLKEDDYVHEFIRLRYGDNIPMAIQHSWVSTKILPTIDVRALENSFKDYLINQGININGPKLVKLSAHLATPEQKKLLNVENVALLRKAHISCTSDGVPYAFDEAYHICTQYEIALYIDAKK